MLFKTTRERRLLLVIGISFSFFLAEISVGFYTRSLALVADAFHYLNDLVGFLVALAALKISNRESCPKQLSFGWQRAQLLGAFFNGVFLLSLGISVFLQSIDRFISLQRVQNPKLMLIVGCVGLTLNILSAYFLHEHDHGEIPGQYTTSMELEDADAISVLEGNAALPMQPPPPHIEHRHNIASPKHKKQYDLGMMGVLLHVITDGINNVGVIIAAAVIWFARYDGRYYADPAVSLAISFMILLSALPLVKRTGMILLESAPLGIDLDDIKHDLETVPGVTSVHELHVWHLNQQKALASAHVVLSDESIPEFIETAKIINECFHAYGIHSLTLQPEITSLDIHRSLHPKVPVEEAHVLDSTPTELDKPTTTKGKDCARRINIPNFSSASLRRRAPTCQVSCGSSCEQLTCCG